MSSRIPAYGFEGIYWSQTNERIGQQLRAYYRACTTEELPPRLLAALKKLDQETEPSAEQAEVIRDIES
jgi:Anti-sigma factor NepR